MIATFSSAAAAATPKPTSNCFVYGTLMASEVVQTLIGRTPDSITGAVLNHHVRHPVKGRVYPAMISAPSTNLKNNDRKGKDVDVNSDSVGGILLLNLSPMEMKMYDYFEDEGVDYKRNRVQVCIPQSSIANLDTSLLQLNFPVITKDDKGSIIVETETYIWALGEGTLDLTKHWDYEGFRRDHLDWYLESTVRPCREEFLAEHKSP